ncbi:MAG TPA: zinc ribbon domain-containing protein [Candidatus Bathyarchaeia archaeon]
MLNSERQLGTIVDLLLPLDIATRYDVYFTDKRIAIVCMGHSNRFDSGVSQSRSYLFGIAPEALTSADEQRKNRLLREEQIKEMPLNEKLKLSKKSCFYTYDEIEEVKLVSGKKHKFTILSKDCVSKFAPNEEQFKQLIILLPTIEMLKNKLSIFGNLDLNAIHEIKTATFNCKFCNYENDLDAIFCQSCGNQIQTETLSNPIITEIACSCCGAKNKVQALFCKKCGVSIGKNQKSILTQS